MIINTDELNKAIEAIYRIEAKLDLLNKPVEPPIVVIPNPIEQPITTPLKTTHTADPSNYIDIISRTKIGDIVGLKAGTYTKGLMPPSYVKVIALDGIGSVYFTGGTAGNSYSNGVINLANTGSTIDGLIAHDPDDITAHAIYVPGSDNKIFNCAGYNGGAHKHKIPIFIGGNDNLVDDSFFFGEGRYTLQAFKSTGNIVRRTVCRWDSTQLGNLTEPNAAFSNYNSNGTLFENCISLDYNSTPEQMNFGGDFYLPHNQGQWPIGNRDIGLYGCIVAYHDKTNDGVNNNNQAFRADHNASDTTNCVGNVIKDFYIKGSYTDFIIKPNYQIDIRNVTRIDVKNETPDGPIKSNGSNLSAGDGADIDHVYINGVKTTESVWPFKHEAIMKQEMAKVPGGNRGWVASGKTLEEYIKGK